MGRRSVAEEQTQSPAVAAMGKKAIFFKNHDRLTIDNFIFFFLLNH